MFKDYYKILDLSFPSTLEEIRIAYRNQAKKWHPDVNSGPDAEQRMQDINEAYLILKDAEAKRRYDIEYHRYIDYIQNDEEVWKGTENSNTKKDRWSDYRPLDNILKRWMDNARSQAAELVEEVKELTKIGGKAALDEVMQWIIPIIILSVLGLVLLAVMK